MIKNIVLDQGSFLVFAEVDGNEISKRFNPDVIASEIQAWHDERVTYFAELRQKEEDLRNELL